MQREPSAPRAGVHSFWASVFPSVQWGGGCLLPATRRRTCLELLRLERDRASVSRLLSGFERQSSLLLTEDSVPVTARGIPGSAETQRWATVGQAPAVYRVPCLARTSSGAQIVLAHTCRMSHSAGPAHSRCSVHMSVPLLSRRKNRAPLSGFRLVEKSVRRTLAGMRGVRRL
ncbi:hypothetical protein HJG60_007755 [Phyllostomus discolor]|uniref:Uncharacterized protein n=1 Tax=Phyllostomus discolor TaxID=89673 RepID=A0A834EY47_9CHIR|nr:hypothetical protein HJG60_007755 [Phyllostomus discolor]